MQMHWTIQSLKAFEVYIKKNNVLQSFFILWLIFKVVSYDDVTYIMHMPPQHRYHSYIDSNTPSQDPFSPPTNAFRSQHLARSMNESALERGRREMRLQNEDPLDAAFEEHYATSQHSEETPLARERMSSEVSAP